MKSDLGYAVIEAERFIKESIADWAYMRKKHIDDTKSFVSLIQVLSDNWHINLKPKSFNFDLHFITLLNFTDVTRRE